MRRARRLQDVRGLRKVKSAEKKPEKPQKNPEKRWSGIPVFREKALCNRHFLWYTYFCIVLHMRTAHSEGVRERGAGECLYIQAAFGACTENSLFALLWHGKYPAGRGVRQIPSTGE